MIVKSSELADLFAVSVRQIQRLTLDGVITPVSDARPYSYDLHTVCPEYCGYLQTRVMSKAMHEAIEQIEADKLEAESRIKKAKAEMVELELDELRGKLHRAEDVEELITSHVLYMRSLMLAMPGKLAMNLAGEHTAAEQAETIKKEVYWILNNLADYRYDPEEYAELVRIRRGLDTDASASTAE